MLPPFGGEAMQRVVATLGEATGSNDGYLQSILSDYFRDIILTFAEYDAESAATLTERSVRQVVAPLLRRLPNPDRATVAKRDRTIHAIVNALRFNVSSLDVGVTTQSIARIYSQFQAAHAERIDARMAEIERHAPSDAQWPEEFQLLPNNSNAASHGDFMQTAEALSRAPNAFGWLILREIARLADFIIRDLMLIPWRTRLEIEAVKLLAACGEYQMRFGESPASVDSLCGMGLLQNEPTESLTGSRFSISPDRKMIFGPAISEVSALLPMPHNSPPLQWEIPVVRK